MSECSICGQPPGECYHLCPNSEFYYSPEQERYDDAWDDGSDDRRERYAAERRDMELEAEYEAAEYMTADEAYDVRGFGDSSPEEHGAGGGDPDEGWF